MQGLYDVFMYVYVHLLCEECTLNFLSVGRPLYNLEECLCWAVSFLPSSAVVGAKPTDVSVFNIVRLMQRNVTLLRNLC